MRLYWAPLLLLAALSASNSANYLEEVDLGGSAEFQIEDPEYLQEASQSSSFPLPPHLKKCTPTMCCPVHLTCGPPYECQEFGKMVRNMEPCL